MIGVAMGCAARGRAITFSSTFAAFFTRTFDHLRMAAVSQTSANFCGSHCGVSIGKWGHCPEFVSVFLLLSLNAIKPSHWTFSCRVIAHIKADVLRGK